MGPDVVGSIIMASMVCGVSTFLLRKSGNALLGQTLPSWRVDTLVLILQAHPSVAGVYDVKTEMVGTDTVRFKAEVQFKPQAITARMLQTAFQKASSALSRTLSRTQTALRWSHRMEMHTSCFQASCRQSCRSSLQWLVWRTFQRRGSVCSRLPLGCTAI